MLALTVLLTLSAASDAPVRPFALVVSGGISRGAYQAGVNWSLVTALRGTRASPALGWTADLSVVTGASAGTINTFLTAMTWCRKDDHKELPQDSLFWKAWIPVSYAGLFDPNATLGPANEEDALFSRDGFKDAIDAVKGAYETPRDFDDNCDVIIGVTIAPADPELQRPRPGSDLSVPSMRFVVPLKFATDERRLPSFRSLQKQELDEFFAEQRPPWAKQEPTPVPGPPPPLPIEDDINFTQFGPVWMLPARDGVIAWDDVRDLNFASSAFPLAFGQKCVSGAPYGEPTRDSICSDPKRERERLFLDGGLFDNVPLDLALDLAVSADGADRDALQLLYVDPELRRPQHASTASSAFRSRGLGAVQKMLMDAVPVARSYELQFYMRKNKTTKRELFSRRAPPIVGETMFSFGAFFLKEFRMYDFYAGVYDGVIEMATDLACGEDAPCRDSVTLERLSAEIPKILPALHLDEDDDARRVFTKLIVAEWQGKHAPGSPRYASDDTIKRIIEALGGVGAPNTLLDAVTEANIAVWLDQETPADGLCRPQSVSAKEDCGDAQRVLDSECRLARIADEVVVRVARQPEPLAALLAHNDREHKDSKWRVDEKEQALTFLEPRGNCLIHEGGFRDWFDDQTHHVLRRAAQVEERDKKAADAVHDETAKSALETRHVGLVLLEAGLRTGRVNSTRGFFTPATTLAHPVGRFVAPHRLTFDVAQTSINLEWRPITYKPLATLAFSVDAGVMVLNSGVLSGFANFLEPNAAVVTRVIVKPDLGIAAELHGGMSARPFRALDDKTSLVDQLGFDASLQLVFLHKLRIGLGVKHLEPPDWRWQTAASLVIGIDDVSGLVSVLSRTAIGE